MYQCSGSLSPSVSGCFCLMDPLVRGTDPRIRIRIRIRTKMSRIHKRLSTVDSITSTIWGAQISGNMMKIHEKWSKTKTWICDACRSMVMIWSVPATLHDIMGLPKLRGFFGNTRFFLLGFPFLWGREGGDWSVICILSYMLWILTESAFLHG